MLEGKTAIITGASRGIGRGIAVKFAKYGAYVGINYSSDEKSAKETLKLVKETSGTGMLLKADVSIPENVKKMIKILMKKRENIDILVNNAGIYFRNNFENILPKTWDKVLSVNLTSCYTLCKEVICYMKPTSKIIFISSQLAFKGSPHGSDYATSKAGMLGLMRSLAIELAEKKINVNAVAPGTIDTDIIKHYSKNLRIKRINKIPLGRLGLPDDIANACLFLASDLSNYITGETINVNGGLYIH
jgi:3-oxoacyl-[acyl-carrier protein] reductase